MKPPKAPSRPPSGKSTRSAGSSRGRAEPVQEAQMELHHEPLGEDFDGLAWWYLDLGPTNQTGPTGSTIAYSPVTCELVSLDSAVQCIVDSTLPQRRDSEFDLCHALCLHAQRNN